MRNKHDLTVIYRKYADVHKNRAAARQKPAAAPGAGFFLYDRVFFPWPLFPQELSCFPFSAAIVADAQQRGENARAGDAPPQTKVAH